MTSVPAAWEGARNLRDLGGLPLVGGGVTRSRRVWRSATPEWMTAQGWDSARRAGVRTVVDLRSPREIGRTPEHPALPAGALAGLDLVCTPTEDPDDPVFLAACGRWLDHPRSYAENLRLFPGLFAAVFRAVADARGGVLVHCQGGRDRTGLVVSMLLSLAGVTSEAILGDYEAGFRGAAAHRGHGLGFDPDTGAWISQEDQAWEPDELDAAIADRLPVLADWVAGLGVADYLNRVGLGQARITRLADLLR